MRLLYHYTSLAAMTKIIEQHLLRPSLRKHRPNDVHYGEGQYFTDVPPGTLRADELSRLLVLNPNEYFRFTHFLAIDVRGLRVNKGRSGVFVIPGNRNLDLTGRIIETGPNAYDLS